jgi:hypothetical protein
MGKRKPKTENQINLIQSRNNKLLQIRLNLPIDHQLFREI